MAMPIPSRAARVAPGRLKAQRQDEGTPSRRLAILKGATRLFHEKGYQAATMRELARDVGIEAASLYNHFPSKQELLADILTATMRDLIRRVSDAVQAAGTDPVERLRAAVSAYVLFHEDALAEASISSTEMRDLEAKHLQRVLELRHDLDAIIKEVLVDGVRAGAFHVDNGGITAMAILSICSKVPAWYRHDGPQTLREIASILTGLCLRIAGVGMGELQQTRQRRAPVR